MVTIKEYAKQKGVSYEAVRKQINRYQSDLKGHISKVGRTNYLDDKAVEFLDGKRAENPVVVVEAAKDEQIQRLQDENKALLIKVAELQDQLLKEKDNVKQLQAEKIELLEEKKKEEDRQEQEPEQSETVKKWWQFWR